MRDQFRDNAPQQICSGVDLAGFSESAQSPRLWQILILLRAKVGQVDKGVLGVHVW